MKAPQLQITAGSVLVLGAIVAVVGVVLWNRKAIASAGAAIVDGAAKAVDKINPASTGNVAYGGVSSVGQTLTGQTDWTLGGWLAEVFDPNVRKVNELYGNKGPVTGGPAGYRGPDVIDQWGSEVIRNQPVFVFDPTVSADGSWVDMAGMPKAGFGG